jgi:hypothetical protein
LLISFLLLDLQFFIQFFVGRFVLFIVQQGILIPPYSPIHNLVIRRVSWWIPQASLIFRLFQCFDFILHVLFVAGSRETWDLSFIEHWSGSCCYGLARWGVIVAITAQSKLPKSKVLSADLFETGMMMCAEWQMLGQIWHAD